MDVAQPALGKKAFRARGAAWCDAVGGDGQLAGPGTRKREQVVQRLNRLSVRTSTPKVTPEIWMIGS